MRPEFLPKLLKPALARLREDGVLLVVYIDDIILLADDPETLVRIYTQGNHIA